MKSLLAVVLSAFFLVSCGQKNQDKPAPKEDRAKIYFNYSLPFKDAPQFTELENRIFAKIRNHEELDYDSLTQAFVEMHVAFYNNNSSDKTNADEINHFVGSLATGAGSAGSDLNQFKVNYEKNLGQVSNREFEYLETAVTIPHIFKETAAQCYSGTSLFEVLNRRVYDSKKFQSLNRVVIFEAGHVLPGYVLKKDGVWRLYGVETTVAGRGTVDYGITKEIREPIRVIDANDFIVVEIFKRHLDPAKSQDLVKAVVASAAAKYDIPAENLEKNLFSPTETVVKSAKGMGTVALTKEAPQSFKAANSSPFAFGQAKVPSGRQKRQEVDNLPPRGSHTFMSPEAFIAVNENVANSVKAPKNNDEIVIVTIGKQTVLLSQSASDEVLIHLGIFDQEIALQSARQTSKGCEDVKTEICSWFANQFESLVFSEDNFTCSRTEVAGNWRCGYRQDLFIEEHQGPGIVPVYHVGGKLLVITHSKVILNGIVRLAVNISFQNTYSKNVL